MSFCFGISYFYISSTLGNDLQIWQGTKIRGDNMVLHKCHEYHVFPFSNSLAGSWRYLNWAISMKLMQDIMLHNPHPTIISSRLSPLVIVKLLRTIDCLCIIQNLKKYNSPETFPVLRCWKFKMFTVLSGNADSDSGSDSESESEKVGSPGKLAKVLKWFSIGCFRNNTDL